MEKSLYLFKYVNSECDNCMNLLSNLDVAYFAHCLYWHFLYDTTTTYHQCNDCKDMIQSLCKHDTQVYITFWSWRIETGVGIYKSMRAERHRCVAESLRHFLSYRMHVIMSLTDGLDARCDLRRVIARILLLLMNVTNSWGESMEIHEWNQVFQLRT